MNVFPQDRVVSHQAKHNPFRGGKSEEELAPAGAGE